MVSRLVSFWFVSFSLLLTSALMLVHPCGCPNRQPPEQARHHRHRLPAGGSIRLAARWGWSCPNWRAGGD
jgi:hypothetical protein